MFSNNSINVVSKLLFRSLPGTKMGNTLWNLIKKKHFLKDFLKEFLDEFSKKLKKKFFRKLNRSFLTNFCRNFWKNLLDENLQKLLLKFSPQWPKVLWRALLGFFSGASWRTSRRNYFSEIPPWDSQKMSPWISVGVASAISTDVLNPVRQAKRFPAKVHK